MKKLLILILSICAVSIATAQYRSGGVGDKIYFGGGFGLSLGTDVTNISASPLVGYRFTDQFSAGVSFTYQYIKFKAIDESFNSTGWGVFSRFLITNEIFLHTEFEHLNYDQISILSNGDFIESRESNNSWFVGGGYRQPISRNASFSVIGLYDVLWKEDKPSPYAEPWQIRAGFAVGF